jgi:hypothetical protein
VIAAGLGFFSFSSLTVFLLNGPAPVEQAAWLIILFFFVFQLA